MKSESREAADRDSEESIFFRGLSSKQMGAIRHCGSYSQRKPGDVISREGDEADCMYVILDGEVDVYRSQPGGEKTIATLTNGDVFGAAAFLTEDHRRVASARVTKPSTLFEIHADPVAFSQVIGDSIATVCLLENLFRLLFSRLLRMIGSDFSAAPSGVRNQPIVHSSSKEALKQIEEALPSTFLTRKSVKKQIRAPEYLYVAGEKSDGFYYIHSGVLEVLLPLPENPEEHVLVGTVQAPAIAGEIGFFSHHQRRASLRASDEVVFSHFSNKHFEALKKKPPDGALKVALCASRHALQLAIRLLGD